MTARFSQPDGETRGHRPRLQKEAEIDQRPSISKTESLRKLFVLEADFVDQFGVDDDALL